MLRRRSEAPESPPVATPRAREGLCRDGRREGEALRLRTIAARETGRGPGVRFMVELQGCPLRCPDCADAEASGAEGGRRVPAAEVAQMAVTYADYMALSGGGLTVAAGDPLGQAPAVAELFRRCRAAGIPTALDSAGRPTVRE